jgi:hypothetical protein
VSAHLKPSHRDNVRYTPLPYQQGFLNEQQREDLAAHDPLPTTT